jgi:hypothetical protein
MQIKKLVIGLMAVGAVATSGMASAGFYQGSLAGWQNTPSPGILDVSGDLYQNANAQPGTTGNLISTNPYATLTVATLTEVLNNNNSLDFNFSAINPGTGYQGGGAVAYTLTANVKPLTGFQWVTLSVNAVGATDVTKQVYTAFGGTLLATLTAIGDTSVSAFIPDLASYYVVDTFYAVSGAVINSATDTFFVPEPTSMLLMTIGFAALGYGRRKAVSTGSVVAG